MLRDAETMYAYEHAFSEAEARAWLQKLGLPRRRIRRELSGDCIMSEPAKVKYKLTLDIHGYRRTIDSVSYTHLLTVAEDKINELYDEWKNGEATEDSFAALASANSEDSGSKDNGGL